MILSKQVANTVNNKCLSLYERIGASAVYDYANSINLEYGYCKSCNTKSPMIETKKECSCAVCGETMEKEK